MNASGQDDIDKSVREKHLLDLFIHPGWKLVLEEMTEARDTLVNTAWMLKTTEEFWRRNGEIRKLNELINFEQVVKAQMKSESDGIYE